jgi:TetR/AcrR family transcriptional regulator, cholesterol catabolism regulator
LEVDESMESDLEARRRDPRYQRLMSATRDAARGGYDAVSMRDLAETARVSLTTVYQFCSSKDHLIAEAHLEVMEDFRAALAKGRRRAGTPEERVRRVMRGMVNALERDEPLTRTLMRAMYSLDSGVVEVSRSVAGGFTAMVDTAIGDDEIADREAVIETLGRVIDSAIYGWLARGDDVARVRETLFQAVHVLLGEHRVGGRTTGRRRIAKPSPAPRRATRPPRAPARGART